MEDLKSRFELQTVVHYKKLLHELRVLSIQKEDRKSFNKAPKNRSEYINVLRTENDDELFEDRIFYAQLPESLL